VVRGTGTKKTFLREEEGGDVIQQKRGGVIGREETSIGGGAEECRPPRCNQSMENLSCRREQCINSRPKGMRAAQRTTCRATASLP